MSETAEQSLGRRPGGLIDRIQDGANGLAVAAKIWPHYKAFNDATTPETRRDTLVVLLGKVAEETNIATVDVFARLMANANKQPELSGDLAKLVSLLFPVKE